MPMVTSGSSIFSVKSWQASLQPRRVVGEEGVVDDVGQLLLAGEVLGQDALAGHVLVLVRALLLLQPVRHLGQVFAVAALGVFSVLAMFLDTRTESTAACQIAASGPIYTIAVCQRSGSKRPAALGFSMPAEWEPHEATWLGWPHNPTDWPDKLDTIRWVYGEIVRKIAPGEDGAHPGRTPRPRRSWPARVPEPRRGGPRARRVHRASDQPRLDARQRPDLRASAARAAETAIVHFHFNAWAKYDDWQKDRRVPETAARLLGSGCSTRECNGKDFVIEGGGIDVNGRGTLLTTEECYLDPKIQVRNPGLGRRGIRRDAARRISA